MGKNKSNFNSTKILVSVALAHCVQTVCKLIDFLRITNILTFHIVCYSPIAASSNNVFQK
jgi:hypothetical protein